MGKRDVLKRQIRDAEIACDWKRMEELQAELHFTCQFCGGRSVEQWDEYGLFAGRYCDDCFARRYQGVTV